MRRIVVLWHLRQAVARAGTPTEASILCFSDIIQCQITQLQSLPTATTTTTSFHRETLVSVCYCAILLTQLGCPPPRCLCPASNGPTTPTANITTNYNSTKQPVRLRLILILSEPTASVWSHLYYSLFSHSFMITVY